MTVQTGNRERAATRWGAAAGIAFVVVFFAGLMLLGTPEGEAPASEWEAWYDDSGNRSRAILAMLFVVISGFAFLWFASSLRTRLRSPAEQLRTMAASTALLFTTMVMIAGVVFGSVAGQVEFGDATVPSGDTISTIEQLGWGLLMVAGGFSAAVFVATVSVLGRRTGVFPGWLTYVGYVAAVLLVFSFMWFPFAAVLIWVLAVSISSLASPSGSGAGAARSPAVG